MAESPSSELPLPFDFRLVHDGFASALVEDEDVDLQHYLTAYKELYKYVGTLCVTLESKS